MYVFLPYLEPPPEVSPVAVTTPVRVLGRVAQPTTSTRLFLLGFDSVHSNLPSSSLLTYDDKSFLRASLVLDLGLYTTSTDLIITILLAQVD
jgi:hypothetical protein